MKVLMLSWEYPSHNVGGLAEVVEHGTTGLLVPPNDVDALSSAVLDVLHHPETAKSRAARAYEIASKMFNWDQVALRTRAVYERISEERRATVWS